MSMLRQRNGPEQEATELQLSTLWINSYLETEAGVLNIRPSMK